MSKEERSDIVEALNSLPDDKKQFVLGYAAGVQAGVQAIAKPEGEEKPEEDKKG